MYKPNRSKFNNDQIKLRILDQFESKIQFPKEEIIKMASEMTKYFTYLGMTRTFANAADSFFMRIFYRCPKMSAAIWVRMR